MKPVDNRSKKLVLYIKILAIIFIVFGIAKYKVPFYLGKDIISALILFIAAYKMVYYFLLFFIISSFFNILYYINEIGNFLYNYEKLNVYLFIIYVATLLWIVISNYICYLSYKCFKSTSNNELIDTNNATGNTNNNIAFQGSGFR